MARDDGAALHAATNTLTVEDVVAKRHTARYVYERRSHAWVRIKHRHHGWPWHTGRVEVVDRLR